MARITLGELKSLVYSRLEGNNLLYSGTEVRAAINGVYQILSMFLGWTQRTVDVPPGESVADRHIYNVPEEIIFPQRVVFEGKVLEPNSLSALVNDHTACLSETTANTGKPVCRWAPVGIRKFIIHPADSVGGGSLQVTGIAEPTLLVDDSDEANIPKEGVTAVVDYSAHIVQCKLQGTPFLQSLALYKNYEDILKLQRYWQTYRQPTMRIDEATGVEQ